MTLQDLGNIGEFTAAIATLVTLGYLAVQIRQNTKTARASTYQAVLESNMRSMDPILFNPDAERIYRIGRRDPGQLTADERPLFRQIVACLLSNYEAIYLQYEHGIVDSEYWRGRQISLQHLLSQPGVRAVWSRREGGSWAVAGFREVVDSLLSKAEGGDEPAAFYEGESVKPSSDD